MKNSKTEASYTHYHKRKAAGGCVDCKEKALPNSIYCDKHRVTRLSHKYKNKRKRVAEGRCYSCGAPRVSEGVGKNAFKCVSCADKQLEAETLRKGVW